MEKTINILKRSVPYLMLLFVTFVACYLMFYTGVPNGDDTNYHFANMLDKYKTLLEGHKLSGISGNIAQGIGLGGGLFYSPLSHVTVAVVAVIFSVFGISFMTSYKIVMLTTVYVSSIFMYRFVLHFTKNNKVAAFIGGACYIVFPYRLYNCFSRVAVAETFGAMFIPLFMMGLYDITHLDKDKEIKFLPFAEVVLGGALMYLSHNITATYMALMGIGYLLFHIHKIVPLLKNKRYLAYGTASVFFFVGICSIALFTQLELMGMDFYNITDRKNMWTDPEGVAGQTGQEWTHSGFLNVLQLQSMGINGTALYSKIVIFLLSCAIFIVLMKIMSKYKELKYVDLFIATLVQILLVALIDSTLEILYASIVFIGIYMFFYFWNQKADEEECEKKIYKNALFWTCVITIVVVFIVMEVGDVWLNAPGFLLNIQFPWRTWSLVQIAVSVIIAQIAHYYGNKSNILNGTIIVVALFIAVNQVTLEKRTHFERNDGGWYYSVDYSFIEDRRSQGHNREYAPQILSDKSYVSKYENSLHKKLCRIVNYSYAKYGSYYFKPVFLEGDGKITVNEAFSPRYDMTITTKEDALIQMPLVYYPGYKITIENLKTGEITRVKAENIDGLIAFEMPSSGEYSVRTDFVGSTLRQVSIALTSVCSVAVVGLLVNECFIQNKKYLVFKEIFKRKKKEEIKAE